MKKEDEKVEEKLKVVAVSFMMHITEVILFTVHSPFFQPAIILVLPSLAEPILQSIQD